MYLMAFQLQIDAGSVYLVKLVGQIVVYVNP